MGWFDEQIRQRKLSDQEVFEESIFRMASVILGRERAGVLDDERILTKMVLDDILKYYRAKPVELPATVKTPEEALDYCLRPHGIMYRSVKLEDGWYRDAFGPMIALRKEDGKPVALIPNIRGYYFRDGASGKKVRVNKKTAEQFDRDAACFYRPLPQKKLGVSDINCYLKDCLDAGDYGALILSFLLVTLFGLIQTPIYRVLTGYVLESGSMRLLIGTAVFMLTSLISAQLVTTVRELMMDRLEIKTSLSVEAAIMARVFNLPASFFRKYSSGELSSRCSAVNQLCALLIGGVFSTTLSSLMSLLYITQIFRYARALVVPSLLVLAASVLVSVIASLMQMRVSKKLMELSAKENGLSFALISGVQKIKLAGAEKRAFARWADAYASAAEYSYNPPLFLIVNGVISTAVGLVGTLVMYYIAVKTDVSGSEYIAFNSAYGTVSGAFSALMSVAISVARIKPILEMADPILKTEPETAENKTMVTSLKGAIELSNVYFRYTESMPYVVNNMSLRIKPGEYVAIVGKTGCGKSTLVRLLLGFETPEKGSVYYDGRDINKLDLRSLRCRIGTVTQDGSLFQGDIYSNIVISAPHLPLDAAWEAAELAGIADDIRAMPMGMQTMISEGAGGISGGQKQRLMIARAVAPKPKILIFDEATSALDNRTQKQVSEALDRLKCTRIVIAHRLSTIKNCDRILVLDQGRIIEDGSYGELIAKNGMFAELVARQRLDTPNPAAQKS